jgi:hypothetical protein
MKFKLVSISVGKRLDMKVLLMPGVMEVDLAKSDV